MLFLIELRGAISSDEGTYDPRKLACGKVEEGGPNLAFSWIGLTIGGVFGLSKGDFGTGALYGARRESLEPDLQVKTQ